MQKMTSAYANKKLKSLEEDKAFWVNKEATAVIKAANAKFKKNILGVKISSITNAIPTTHNICHINTIFLLLY